MDASLTSITKVKVPELDGAPEVVPELERVSPDGKVPEIIFHE